VSAIIEGVLSGWQTVVVALGGAAVGGALTLVATWLRGRQERAHLDRRLEHEREQQTRQLSHERSEQWSERLLRAADDFSTGVEQSILGVRDVIAVKQQTIMGRSDAGELAAATAEAKRRHHEAEARLARIRLLFGEEADAVSIARTLLSELLYARRVADRPDDTDVWQALDKVNALHRDFNGAAFDMISSPRWRVGSSLEVRYRVEGVQKAEGEEGQTGT
jgi:hypothetical protein